MTRTARSGSVLILVAFAIGTLLAAPAASAAGRAANDRVKTIVTFNGPPGKAGERLIEKAGGKVRAQLKLVNGISAWVPRGQLRQLAKEPGVRTVEPDVTVTAIEPVVADVTATSGDLEYDNAWGVSHIGTQAVHDAGVRGAGVKVAVIDTGIDYIHDDPLDTPYVVDPEFLNNYKGGYDFVNNDADPMDDMGHGTHVAGILAAEKNGYLVVGVAPAVDLYAIKILDANGQGDESSVVLALQWALDNNIDIVNMSFGTHTNVPAMQTAVANAAAQGLLMVAASGNVNPLDFNELLFGCPVAYPAAYPQVLSTTFTNGNDALTGYSCTGPEVDFASPGDQIYSTVPIGSCALCDPHGYASLSGTSMAAPHLAGTVALLLSAGITDSGAPGLFDDVRAQLCAHAGVGFGVNNTPIPVNDPRYPKYFGCGILDADAAVLPLVTPPGNHAPVATFDTASTLEDTPVDVPVLANDTDADGDTLSVASVASPHGGSATINADGTVHFVPTPNWTADASFDYTVSDGHGGTANGQAIISITPVNDPPVAVDDSVTVAEDAAATNVAVLANDTDVDLNTLSTTAVTDPPHGTTSVNGDGTVAYTPDASYNGPDGFDYTVSDGTATDSGHVAVTVTAVDDPPTASPKTASTTQPNPVTITLTGTDPDTCQLTFQAINLPDHGGIGSLVNAPCVAGSPNSDSATVVYTPTAGYSGPDFFTYRVLDATGASAEATVSITVAAAPPPPPSPIHVGDLDGSTTTAGKNWTAKVTIQVHTAAHANVAGALVTGTWGGGASGTGTCTTNNTGVCTVSSAKLSRAGVASATFTITSVTKAGSTYTPGSNHDPDGDSNGTTITVLRPL